MAKQMNLPMLVAQHGDKAGYILASILALAYVIFMISGPARGDLTVSQFRSQVADLESSLEADDGEQARRLGVAGHVAGQLPERHGEGVRPSELPLELVTAPRPGLDFTVAFEGQKGAPAHSLELIEAVNQEIQLRWRPSQHGDTSQYRVDVWEMDDEGFTSPPSSPSRSDSGPGRHMVSQVSSPADPDAWVEYTIRGVTDNVRYGVLVHSVDGRGNNVSYRGNREGQRSEDNTAQHGVTQLQDQGLFVEATPAGQRLAVPQPTDVRVRSQSLAGVRLAWNDPTPGEDTVPLDAVRVQIWRWQAESPETSRTLLTPISQERHDGWSLRDLNGQFVDHEIQPETEFVYSIRFYHVGEAYPPMNRTGRARTHGVSHSQGEEFGDEIREIAYIGEVITIDYPQREPGGREYEEDRQDGTFTILEDETYVYATEEFVFDTSLLEEDRVLLYNRPLFDILRIHPGDPRGRSPQIGSAEVHVTKYFDVSDPDTGELVWERFGATFVVEGRMGEVNPIGEPARPETAGPHGVDIDEYEEGRWQNAVGRLDFSTTVVVVGFYGLNFGPGYELEYVEFYDIGYQTDDALEQRWPFKVYASYLQENPLIGEYQAQHDFGRTIDQTLALYSRYKEEIEYPARQAVVEHEQAEHFVHEDMQGRLLDWMFEWQHEPRLEAPGAPADAGEPPMWEFSLAHGVRFFPRSWLADHRRRDSLDPTVDMEDIETWHNEVHRLQLWAHDKLAQRFAEKLGEIGDSVPVELREFVLTPGFNEVALPMLADYIEENRERDIVIELGELIYTGLREHHNLEIGRAPSSVSGIVEAVQGQLSPLLTDLYGPRD